MTSRQILVMIVLLGAWAGNAQEYVDRADANGDGFVSLHELRAAHYADPEFNRRIEQSFELYDRNGDGMISADERRVTREAMAERAANRQAAARAAAAEANGPGQASSGGARAPSVGEVLSLYDDRYAADNDGGNTSNADAQTSPQRQTARQGAAAGRAEVSNTAVTGSTRSAGQGGAGTSRSESWIREIDTDNSGGASIAELVASADGRPWFREADFHAVDRNGDGDLDVAELDVFISSLERRQR